MEEYPRMKYLALCLLLGFALSAGGQTCFFGGYQNAETPFWDLIQGKQGTMIKNGFTAGLYYRLPIRNSHWEILPGISYSHFHQQHSQALGGGFTRADFFTIGLQTRLYPLGQFAERRNSYDWIEGLFVQGGLGWGPIALLYEAPDNRQYNLTSSLQASIGGGLSLTYSDRLALFPFFRYAYFPAVRWEGLHFMRTSRTDYFFSEETFIHLLSFELHVFFDLQNKAQ